MEENLNITCLTCDKKLSTYIESTDSHDPEPEVMHQSGNVAVPNCGWFCNQKCALEFEVKYNVKFEKDENGIIDYYR